MILLGSKPVIKVIKMFNYDFKKIEKKWQNKWIKDKTFYVDEVAGKKKYYALMEFPGPSAKGIHMGNTRSYIPQDVNARFKRFVGYNVLYPIGYDAFGLPTENFALKEKIHPREATDENIKRFREQFIKLGFSFDWDREIDTSDKKYYKWTQFIFLKLYENGLVYKDYCYVNYCPNCQVILSNEDSQGGKCDRCGSLVEQKKRKVWFLKITAYAEKMLKLIDESDYSDSVKLAQRNWIGKSDGAIIKFPIYELNEEIDVFTTRPDTIFGVTFIVVSPEHPILDKIKSKIKNISQIEKYQDKVKYKTIFERTEINKDKTGIKVEGISLINPVTNDVIPLFVSDYVVMSYGCGAVMAVPAHDERDYEFAKKFKVNIKQVIEGGDINKAAYTGNGKIINSGFLNGLDVEQAKKRIIEFLEEKSFGYYKVCYKMQDWAFNRQRYWGEPIPLINCPHCGTVPLSTDELPLELPYLEDYQPNAEGDSPLSKNNSWVNVQCPICKGEAKRETDTMPQWAGSSWYWIRYCDPKNDDCLAQESKQRYWLPVDLYSGGVEHVTRHMIYAQFWNLFLYDIGLVTSKNPFKKRICCGLLLGSNGEKMSKSKGNAVDPLEILENYPADALRIALLFIGDFEKSAVWTEGCLNGAERFLNRVWDIKKFLTEEDVVENNKAMHDLITRSRDMYNNFRHNTIIAELMKFVNEIEKNKHISRKQMHDFLIILNPIAPHISSELFSKIFNNEITNYTFPNEEKYSLFKNMKIEIPIQINGKVKGKIEIDESIEREDLIEIIKEKYENLRKSEIIKVIYISKRIINFIVK